MPDNETGLEAVARSDRLLDALAAGDRMSSADPVASMLAAWRDDVRRTPDSHVVSLAEAAAALAEGTEAHPRHRFGLTVVGGVAAALLCLGGFGAVIYGAGPGDALYGMRTALFGSTPTTREDQVGLAAQTELAQVQRLVQQGQWQQAQDKLAAVSTAVEGVTDVQRKEELINQWNNLTAKVVARNPGATLTPGAPPPVLPGMSAPLLPGPSVVPGSPSPSSPLAPSPYSLPPSTTSSPSATTSSPGATTSDSETPTGPSDATTASFPATTTPSPVAGPLPPPPPWSATTTETAPTTSTTTAAASPPPTTTTVTTTVTSAPRNEQSSPSAEAPNSPATATSPQQQEGPAVVNQQQTSESPSTSTVDNSHGEQHGSPPGPRGNGAAAP